MRTGDPGDSFTWAVGIEDTFVPQVATRTGRVLDEYELTQHYRYWREDLALAASLGVTAIRYGIPWYRVNPAPGEFDWSWTDEVLQHMVRDLGLRPIVDLMHYGCPLWLEREFANPDYPERVAEYASAFVERYRDLATEYTPLNEPLVNIRFCGYTGLWPPYLRGVRGYTRILMAIARGMSLTVAAIRELQPQARIVHVEATNSIATEDPSLEKEVELAWRRQFLPTDLLLGRVDGTHPLTPWLLENGAASVELDWLHAHPQRIDVLGANYYPGMSCSRLARRDGAVVRGHYYGGVVELTSILHAYHQRYGVPIMLTETSSLGAVWRRRRWMDESIALVQELRASGMPLVGYTWWPLFSLLRWEYRRGSKPASSYLAHMGLWDLRDDGTGKLLRERTPLADRYEAYVRGTGPLDNSRVGTAPAGSDA